jgi:disintegrin and metalloproteinase domain-containing protein 10
VCLTYDAIPCFCSEEDKLCDVCCQFTSNGPCVSTYDYPSAENATIQSGFPCKNFTGYCDDTGVCIFVDTNTPLDDLRNLIPSFTSIVNWLKDNWYWVLAGVILTVIVIILLQVTYRRKKLKNKNTDNSYQQQTDEVAENLRLLEQRRRENEATRL